MTPADIERVAHEVRLQIQQSTCCPLHAGEVLMHVLAGFALDDANDNPHQAAATIMRGAKEYAQRVRTGRFVVMRSSH
ncbi:MAG TPA: hypothetical protein VGD45_20270 [Steroidobacter sp.]|uniref:hypothetical protein n=1 Tax=Steroidobacter sp. TaxID=1978227 RepID=UPI002ED88DCF